MSSNVAIPATSTVLVIGGPGVGKTVYGTQLLGRLRRGGGRLTLRSAPATITPFERALDRLAQGLAPKHTGASTHHELTLPIAGPSDLAADIVWPDYGGEQAQWIVSRRRVPHAWETRVRAAIGWMLFIRSDRLHPQDDVISRLPVTVAQAAAQGGDEDPAWSDAATLVELLQVLLFVRGTGFASRVMFPPLTVLLSCWDELGRKPGDRPMDELKRRLPMLANFITGTWGASAIQVLGLSAQGRPLREDVIDEDFVDKGPEHFGFVVLSDGSESHDLTLPIAELLERGSSLAQLG